ncbi:MAG: hypothetical protein RJA22_977 [Verrucomicrobiota bacterium]|jgi:hypothetical protein
MGFPQLLAANRSLRNIRNGPSRYKMTQANLLPRFGAERESLDAGHARVVLEGRAEARFRAGRAPVGPAVEGKAPAPAFQPRSAGVRRGPWWRRWSNPFASRGGANGAGLVQEEFLLEAVAPVRNQFAENDLDLVGRPEAVVAAPPQEGEGRPAAAGFLRRVWRRGLDRVLRRERQP